MHDTDVITVWLAKKMREPIKMTDFLCQNVNQSFHGVNAVSICRNHFLFIQKIR